MVGIKAYLRGMRASVRFNPSLRTDRLWEIDAWRGVAMIMMVIYHFVWDLHGLGGYDIAVRSGFWKYFQLATASSFIAIVGVALAVRYQRMTAPGGAHYAPIFQRGLQVFSWGLVVGAVTYLFQPSQYVRFGILHLIGLSILIAYPFLRFRRLNLILGISLLLLGKLAPLVVQQTGWLDWLVAGQFVRPAFDYFPVIPWFGVVLIGIFIGNTLYRAGTRRFPLPDLSHLLPARLLRLMGQNSLLLYLIHQPILIAVLTLLGLIRL